MDPLDVVVERISRVDWKTDSGRRESRVRLMQEFLRRAALYAEAYGRTERWPFFDIAASVDANAREVPWPEPLRDLAVSSRVAQVLRSMLNWAARTPREVGGLPDPYEPLLLFFERGGGFTVENRMIDVDSAGIPFRDRSRYARAEPFVALDPATLDALDAAAAPAVAATGEQVSDIRTSWRRLLSTPEGPGGVHATSLALARTFAQELPVGDAGVLLGDAHEALAAQVVLVGPQVAEEFCTATARLIAAVAIQLSDEPRASYARAALGMLTLQRLAESCGVALQLPRFRPEVWASELLYFELASTEERLLLALLALDSEEREHARVVLEGLGFDDRPPRAPDGPGPWVAALVATLDAAPASGAVDGLWQEFLHAFPGWLAQGQVAWSHLLLVARVVLGQVGGTAASQTAAVLRQQVIEFATPVATR